jgi:hypothetical protein
MIFRCKAMADPAWETVSYPVTRDHYRKERLGESFIEYIASNWPSYIAGLTRQPSVHHADGKIEQQARSARASA